MIARVFDSAVEPDDLESIKQMFREKVRPAFEGFAGCRDIRMEIGIDEHSRDLIDVAVISNWESVSALEAAVATSEYEVVMRDFRPFFQQTPLVRQFEIVD